MEMDVWTMLMVMGFSIPLMNALKQKQDNLFQKLAAVTPNSWRLTRMGMVFQILMIRVQAHLKERPLMLLVARFKNPKKMMKQLQRQNRSFREEIR